MICCGHVYSGVFLCYPVKSICIECDLVGRSDLSSTWETVEDGIEDEAEDEEGRCDEDGVFSVRRGLCLR